jgi:hypothetical protein
MRGAFCISIDLELGWGIWDKPDADYFQRCVERERDIVMGLLRMFMAHEIEATWAIVGRILELDENRAHSTRYGARLWYAPDLVEAIARASIRQDIGSHSYAHVYFGETSRERLRADLVAARRVHDRHGLPFSSFVFPRNQIAHVDLLAESGVLVYRGLDEGWHIDVRRRLGTLAGRAAHLGSTILAATPHTVRARPGGPVTELPSSMLFMGRKGVRGQIPRSSLITKARRGLRAAAERGECFHLWMHPSNFYHRTSEQLEDLELILRTASDLRRSGDLELRSMRSVGER